MGDGMGGSGRWDLGAMAREFPDAAETMLLDRYLLDTAERSVRLFRVYRGAPAHFHRGCDETLYVLSGRATFWMGEAANVDEFGPGELLCFARGTVHAMPEIVEGPVVFLAIDTPRRDPADVVFVDARTGTAATFIAGMD